MAGDPQVLVEADAKARTWLGEHRSTEPRAIADDVTRCCGGGRICNVQVRKQSRRDDIRSYVTAALEDGTKFLIDHRAAARLPSRFKLTLRGLGALRHLDLDLNGEKWGALLFG